MKKADLQNCMWINTFDYPIEELDYTILDRHIEQLTLLAQVTNSGITVFDNYQKKHVFTSCNFFNLLNYDMEQIRELDISTVISIRMICRYSNATGSPSPNT